MRPNTSFFRGGAVAGFEGNPLGEATTAPEISNPPARKNLFTPGPDDEGAYCYRCDHLVLEPCDGWLCPIRVW